MPLTLLGSILPLIERYEGASRPSCPKRASGVWAFDSEAVGSRRKHGRRVEGTCEYEAVTGSHRACRAPRALASCRQVRERPDGTPHLRRGGQAVWCLHPYLMGGEKIRFIGIALFSLRYNSRNSVNVLPSLRLWCVYAGVHSLPLFTILAAKPEGASSFARTRVFKRSCVVSVCPVCSLATMNATTPFQFNQTGSFFLQRHR